MSEFYPGASEQPTVALRATRTPGAGYPGAGHQSPDSRGRLPPSPSPEGWRGLVTAVSLVAVALVPGAAMAAGAITAAAGAVCDFGSFCLYSGANFTGQRAQYDGARLFCQAEQPGLDAASVLPGGVRSVYNNTATGGGGFGVKAYNESGRLVLPTVGPGREVRSVDDQAVRGMHVLCAYPRLPAPALR